MEEEDPYKAFSRAVAAWVGDTPDGSGRDWTTCGGMPDGAYTQETTGSVAAWVLWLVRDGERTYLPRQIWKYQVKELFKALGYSEFAVLGVATEKPKVENTLDLGLPQRSVEQMPQEPAVDFASQINEGVAAKLASLNPLIKDKIIDLKADEEITRRTEMALKALAKLEEAERNLAKIKPDHVIKDAQTGAVLQQGMTPGKFAEKEKAEKLVTTLKTALSLALAEGKYDALKKALGGEKAEKTESEG